MEPKPTLFTSAVDCASGIDYRILIATTRAIL